MENVTGPRTTGDLKLRTINPNDNPSLKFNYFKDPEDLKCDYKSLQAQSVGGKIQLQELASISRAVVGHLSLGRQWQHEKEIEFDSVGLPKESCSVTALA
ncbi:hypothetical protein GH714_040227 [Hevea brasiliensis]|uniref:Uncharacterized protein n=1 Tax=Hevea brasiliensis TaxID=3981 RepID=A0A6A6MTF6_HEVBR|nr:hypothetical protein GH714_040227 [Hevea brasiliensis]